MAPSSLFSRSKLMNFKNDDIEQIVSLARIPSLNSGCRKIAYLVKVKGEKQPILFPSQELQQIAAQKIIKYYEDHKLSLQTLEDIEAESSPRKEQNSPEKSENSQQKSEKNVNLDKAKPKLRYKVVDAKMSQLGEFVYTINVEGSVTAESRTVSEDYIIKNLAQAAIDYLEKPETGLRIEEYVGLDRELLIKRWILQ